MMEGQQLEERLKRLEEEFQGIQQPVKNALFELRKLVSELENPFNYMSKFLESKEVPLEVRKVEAGEKEGGGKGGREGEREREKEGEGEGGSDSGREILEVEPKRVLTEPQLSPPAKAILKEEYAQDEMRSASLLQLQLNVMITTEFLLRLFGRDGVKKMLAEYRKDGWLNGALARALEDALQKLEETGYPLAKKRASYAVGLQEHLIALYILYRLSVDPQDHLLPLLLVLLSRSELASPYQLEGRISEKDAEWG